MVAVLLLYFHASVVEAVGSEMVFNVDCIGFLLVDRVALDEQAVARVLEIAVNIGSTAVAAYCY